MKSEIDELEPKLSIKDNDSYFKVSLAMIQTRLS